MRRSSRALVCDTFSERTVKHLQDQAIRSRSRLRKGKVGIDSPEAREDERSVRRRIAEDFSAEREQWRPHLHCKGPLKTVEVYFKEGESGLVRSAAKSTIQNGYLAVLELHPKRTARMAFCSSPRPLTALGSACRTAWQPHCADSERGCSEFRKCGQSGITAARSISISPLKGSHQDTPLRSTNASSSSRLHREFLASRSCKYAREPVESSIWRAMQSDSVRCPDLLHSRDREYS